MEDIKNKKFKNISTGESIQVMDKFGDLAILKGGGKVRIDELNDTSKYSLEERINPEEFLDTSNSYGHILDNIKKIPTDNPQDENVERTTVNRGGDDFKIPQSDQSIAYEYSEDREREELMKKYGATDNSVKSSVDKQNEEFSKYLQDDNEKGSVQKTEVNNKSNEKVIDPQYDQTRHLDDRHRVHVEREPVQQKDPIISMFENVKKSVDFEIDIKLENKIPRLDFIEMMEDSYETSIIDFLSEKFTNEILNDPTVIKEEISSKIRKLVNDKVNRKDSKKSIIKKEKPKKLSAKQRTEKVKKMDSIEKIESFLEKEKAKTVLKAGEVRMEQLKKED